MLISRKSMKAETLAEERLERKRTAQRKWVAKKRQKLKQPNVSIGTSSSANSVTATVSSVRTIENEKAKVATGKKSGALSSTEALYYHDIPTELLRRIAKRYTVGHKKYSPDITMNLNWRQGLNDPTYVMDRLNHMFEHMINFLEDGDSRDDNLGAIVWCAGFLMDAEKHAPQVLRKVLGQSHLFGIAAVAVRNALGDSK